MSKQAEKTPKKNTTTTPWHQLPVIRYKDANERTNWLRCFAEWQAGHPGWVPPSLKKAYK
jgi:hypothetical protein